MDQKKTASLIIIFIIVIVLALGGIWYWQSQKGKVEDLEEKLPGKIDTSTWLPYVVGYIQFRYPADWEIEEHEVTLGSIKQKNPFGFITQNVLAQTQETATEITLTPPAKQSEKDIIKIGGKVKDCKELETGYKCEEKIDIPVYTASKSDTVLQTFNNLVNTFDIYFEVADVDTGIAIDNVKIIARYVPIEYREYSDCFNECVATERDAKIRCAEKCGGETEEFFRCTDECEAAEKEAIKKCPDKCGAENEKVFTKEEFKKYLNEGHLGTYIYTVESEGYKTMSTHTIKSDELRKFGELMMMSPSNRIEDFFRTDVPELSKEYIQSLTKPGTALVMGFVVDEVLRKPLEGVRVNILKLNIATTTNARGFYFLNVSEYPGKIDSCQKLIETALTYTYSKDGFKTFERGENYPYNVEGVDVAKPFFWGLNATMFYGTGKIIHEYIPPGACQSRR